MFLLYFFALSVDAFGQGLSPDQLRHFPASQANLVTRELAYVPSPQIVPEDDLANVPEMLPAPPHLTESEQLERVQHEDVLSDPLSRISSEFDLPKGMEERVRFWFDVYTKYNRFTHVIHHSRFPWITFEILDFTEAVKEGKGPEWLKVERSQKFVRQRRNEIRKALLRLAANPGRNKTELEQHLANKLKVIPGKRKNVYYQAAQHLRSQLGQSDFFIAGLRRSSRYLPVMEDTFIQAGLPVELTRMPFVESSFNEKAESKVGASGIWQVMPATGRAYGLVSNQIDERNSPYKATQMAARLLRSYNRALGNWPLAITSYNHGIGNIQKAIRAARSRDLPTIVERYHKGDFKFASSNFYACFLAALYAERYSEVVFPTVVRDPMIAFERLVMTRAYPLKHLLRDGAISKDDIFAYNLDLSRKNWNKTILPKGYVLHLPPGRRDLLNDGFQRATRILPPLAQTNHSAPVLERPDVQLAMDKND